MRHLIQLFGSAIAAVVILLMLPAGSAAVDRFVSPSGTDTGNLCTDSLSPCATVQHAIDSASNFDRVNIAVGQYVESFLVSGLNNITFQGGWKNNFTYCDSDAALTVFESEEGQDHIFGIYSALVNMSVEIQNLTLRNSEMAIGSAPSASTLHLRVENCIIDKNEIGMMVFGAGGTTTLEVIDSVIKRSSLGGGILMIAAYNAEVDIVGSRIEGNTGIPTGEYAGGITIDLKDGGNSSIRLARTIISGNGGKYGGLKIESEGGTTAVELENALIYNNNGYAGGGGLAVISKIEDAIADNTTVRLRNCTVTGNTTSQPDSLGGGVYVNSDDDANRVRVEAINSIVWGNTAAGGGDDIALDGLLGDTKVFAQYSNIHEVQAGAGIYSSSDMFDTDPLFENPTGGDYRLSQISPMIDAGLCTKWISLVIKAITSYSVVAPEEDFEGDLRPEPANQPCCEKQLGCDIGADEFIEMTAPISQSSWVYPAVAQPVKSNDAERCKPFAAGPAAGGLNPLDLRIGLGRFATPVDIYAALYIPDLSPEIFFITSTGGFLPASSGIAVWRTHTTEAIDESLFGPLPATALPAGTYYLFLLISRTGSLAKYYLWASSVTLPLADP